jgi:hypothetical protein
LGAFGGEGAEACERPRRQVESGSARPSGGPVEVSEDAGWAPPKAVGNSRPGTDWEVRVPKQLGALQFPGCGPRTWFQNPRSGTASSPAVLPESSPRSPRSPRPLRPRRPSKSSGSPRVEVEAGGVSPLPRGAAGPLARAGDLQFAVSVTVTAPAFDANKSATPGVASTLFSARGRAVGDSGPRALAARARGPPELPTGGHALGARVNTSKGCAVLGRHSEQTGLCKVRRCTQPTPQRSPELVLNRLRSTLRSCKVCRRVAADATLAEQRGGVKSKGRVCGHLGLRVTADRLVTLEDRWRRPRRYQAAEQVANSSESATFPSRGTPTAAPTSTACSERTPAAVGVEKSRCLVVATSSSVSRVPSWSTESLGAVPGRPRELLCLAVVLGKLA